MTALVTVYVATYNRPDYLVDALDSIGRQTLSELRVVVVDNASTLPYDVPLAVVAADPRMAFERRPHNLGGAGSIQEILSRKHPTPYAMVFHDDDVMHPELLERLVGCLQQRSDVVFAACELASFVGAVPEFAPAPEVPATVFATVGDLAEALLGGLSLPFSSVVYRTSALADVRGDLDRYSIVFDRPLLLDLARRGPVAVLPQPLLRYRRHDEQDSKSRVLQSRHLVQLFCAYRDALREGPLPAGSRTLHVAAGREAVDAWRRLDSNNRESLASYLRALHAADVLPYPYLLAALQPRLARVTRALGGARRR